MRNCSLRLIIIAAASLSTPGCVDYGLPPDQDTSTDSADEVGSDGVGDQIVNDGGGLGLIFPPRLRDVPGLELDPVAKNALVIGAPAEAWEGVVRSGQVSVLIDSGADGLAVPSNSPRTLVEDVHSSACGAGQRFAWQLLPDRQLGGALTFFTRNAGGEFGAQQNVPLASAPKAGANSGRAMIYMSCLSCAIFPKQDGQTNRKAGTFGASMAVGFFAQGTEGLAIGAPLLDGSGRVAIIGEQSFRAWDYLIGIHGHDRMLEGERECQCGTEGELANHPCTAWDETLQGGFTDEEFGAALAAGDFNCDGLDDLAVGAPGAALPAAEPPTIPNAGAAYVYFASPRGLGGGKAPTILRQGSFETKGEPEVGDRFGATLIAGNFNGARRVGNNRSCFDLAVAAPGEDDSSGEIQIFEGSPTGLTFGGPILHLADIFDASGDPGGQFGWSLVAGDFNEDGFDDLAIGAPGDSLGGSVSIILGSAAGLDLDKSMNYRQGNNIAGEDESGDQFGFSLSWTRIGLGTGNSYLALAVGIPGEDGDVGQVRIFRIFDPFFGSDIGLSGDVVITQAHFMGDTAAGDRFGATLMQPRAMPQRPWQ